MKFAANKTIRFFGIACILFSTMFNMVYCDGEEAVDRNSTYLELVSENIRQARDELRTWQFIAEVEINTKLLGSKAEGIIKDIVPPEKISETLERHSLTRVAVLGDMIEKHFRYDIETRKARLEDQWLHRRERPSMFDTHTIIHKDGEVYKFTPSELSRSVYANLRIETLDEQSLIELFVISPLRYFTDRGDEFHTEIARAIELGDHTVKWEETANVLKFSRGEGENRFIYEFDKSANFLPVKIVAEAMGAVHHISIQWEEHDGIYFPSVIDEYLENRDQNDELIIEEEKRIIIHDVKLNEDIDESSFTLKSLEMPAELDVIDRTGQ